MWNYSMQDVFQHIRGPVRFSIDLGITLLLWLYYTAGFILFFSIFYIIGAVSFRKEAYFQRLNHLFYRGFFVWLRILMPWQKLRIDPDVKSIRSSVIVCNHLSYLDPLLLMAIFPRHRTIVRSDLFRLPVFGHVLRASGYMPSATGGALSDLLIRQMENMNAFLASGGNLFVFPEGTRSRDGRLGNFNKGAFKIARKVSASICAVHIADTGRLFEPGRFLFHTCRCNTIRVTLRGCIPPEQSGGESNIQLMTHARQLLSENPAAYANALPESEAS